jgi:hypothetical protein
MAVLADLPSDTQLKLSIVGCAKAAFSNKTWFGATTYVLLSPGASVQAIEKEMSAAVDRQMPLSSVDVGGQHYGWRWTHGFACYIDLGIGMFVTVGATALVIALATVSAHAWLFFARPARHCVALRIKADGDALNGRPNVHRVSPGAPGAVADYRPRR